VIVLSPTEAEYIEAAETATSIVNLRRLLSEVGIPQTSSIRILVDNSACVHLAKDWDAHHRTKHVDIKIHYIRQAHDEGHILLVHLPRKDQVADMLAVDRTGGVEEGVHALVNSSTTQ
jgi:hypothetical protein